MNRLFLFFAIFFSSHSYSEFYISDYIGFSSHHYRLKRTCSNNFPSANDVLECAQTLAGNYQLLPAHERPGSYELSLPFGVVAIVSPISPLYCGTTSALQQLENERQACFDSAGDNEWSDFNGTCNETLRKIESTCVLHSNEPDPQDNRDPSPQDNRESNEHLLALLKEFKTQTNNSLLDVVEAIRDSSTDAETKSEALESILESLEKTNKEGYQELKESFDSLNFDDLNSRLEEINSSSLQGSQAIVNAISQSSSGGNPPAIPIPIPNQPTDMSSVESGLSQLGDKIDGLGQTSKQANSEPDKSGESYWNSSYSEGFKGIWQDKRSELQQTRFVDFLNSFKLQLGGDAAVPDWNTCFDLGIADFGCHDLTLDSRIWGAIRIFILITASFLCRRLVFGG